MDDNIQKTIATYDVIAPNYNLTATPDLRAWEEDSMKIFLSCLKGKLVLVPGCGDGRDFLCIFYINMKSGNGEGFRSKPGPDYPGGDEARKVLQ